MFKFLREKLKQSVSIFSKKLDETPDEEIPQDVSIKKEEETQVDAKVFDESIKESGEEITVDGKKLGTEGNKCKEEIKEKKHQHKEGFFKRIFQKRDEFDELEEADELKDTRETHEVQDIKFAKEEKKKEDRVISPKKIASGKSTPKILFKNDESAEIWADDVAEHRKIRTDVEQAKAKLLPEQPEEDQLTGKQTGVSSLGSEEQVIDDKTEQETKEREETRYEENSEDQKKGFFSRLTEKVVTKKISAEKFDELFWDIEVALLENNVAVEVIEKIKEDIKKEIVGRPIKRNMVEGTILISLKSSIEDVLSSLSFDIIEMSNEKKPYVICFIGINGSGKTTTIAKVAKIFLNKNKKVVLAAADTFRAAAIDQLQVHADNLGVKMIKHDYGSDPAAVAFDAIQYAKAKNVDVVLIDTAGRMHSNINLIDEMKKIIRVADPDLKLFVGEAITGNDCIEQAVTFNEAIDIDGIILAKSDIDEKGGASISVSYVTKKPILYLGTGQGYADIKPFDKEEIIRSLGLEA